MNIYLQAIFHQLEVANESIINLIGAVPEDVLDEKIFDDKRKIRELLSHIAVIYRADFMIMNQATMEEMVLFYEENAPTNLSDIKNQISSNFQFLKERMSSYSTEEIVKVTTSYWGVSYRRFEWLVEIVAHIYHHRAQLHTLLLAKGIDPKVGLFE